MVWEIVGQASLETIWRAKACGGMEFISSILRCLASKHLTQEEILASHIGEKSFLKVEYDMAAGHLTCGKNPHYIAKIELIQHGLSKP